MKPNVGGVDRIGRIIVGILLLIAGLAVPMSATWQVVVLVVAAIALVTGFVKFCPINLMLGINTCKLEEKK